MFRWSPRASGTSLWAAMPRHAPGLAVRSYRSGTPARARLTQLLNLLLLAPEIQERVLRNQIATERRLRVVVGEANWEDQLALGCETSHDSVGDAEWLLEQAARSRWRRCAGPSASGAPATG